MKLRLVIALFVPLLPAIGFAQADPTAKSSNSSDSSDPKAATPSPARPKQISGGVLNGKAQSLPKPAYPPAAFAVGASGAVSVQVLIDEEVSFQRRPFPVTLF